MPRFERSKGRESRGRDNKPRRRESNDSGSYEEYSKNRDSRGRKSRGRDSRGGKGFGRERRAPLEMTKVICDSCKAECEVPFKPSSSKPVYCSDCFKNMIVEGEILVGGDQTVLLIEILT